jgi:hypothetical protein
VTTVSSPRSARPGTDHTAGTRSWISIPPLWQAVLAFVLYAAAALAMMWPVPLHPTHMLYGGTGDPVGSMATLHAEVATGQPGFLPGTLHQFNAPGGLPLPWVMGLASLPTSVLLYVLGVLFGPVMAYNVFAFAAFPLSGGAMFLLVRRVTGNSWAAFLAGWALAFFAYAQVKAGGHYELVHSWVIVLAVWRVLEMVQRPSRRNGLLAGLAIVFAMAWTPYFILLAGIAYVTLAMGGLVNAARNHRLMSQVPAQAVAAALVLLYLVTFYVLSLSVPNGQGTLRTNSVAELNAYSARPLEYIIPNQSNPVFGSLTSHYLQTHLHGSNFSESTLYLGISGLILAAIALFAAVRNKLPPQWRPVTFLGALMAIVALWASAPPHGEILGFNVPFPSYFITHISSTWRVYARLVTVVMIGVALLAGIGLAWLMRGRGLPLQFAIVAVAAVAIIGVDYRPATGLITPLGPRTIDAAVKRLPPGIVAEYPLGVGGSSYDAIWDQQWEGHPVLNGYQAGTFEESRALSVSDPADPATPSALAAIGVRYVLDPNNVTTVGLRFPRSGYRLLASDPSGSVYAVISHRTAVAAFPADGFGAPEQSPQGPFEWLQQPTGQVEIDGNCGQCRVVVRMLLGSFARPRFVQIRDTAGRLLFEHWVANQYDLPVALSVAFSRKIRLVLTSKPGPIRIQSVVPSSPDQRSVSVALSRLNATPVRGR